MRSKKRQILTITICIVLIAATVVPMVLSAFV